MQAEPAQSVITIEPFDPSDFPLLWQWCQAFWDSVCDDNVPRPQVEFVMFKEIQGSTNFGVYRDGQLGGILSFDPINSWVCQAHVVFRKEFWGRDTTERGIQLGIELAWKIGYTKIVALVYEHNIRIKALIQAVGGKQEGYHVAQTRQNGKPVDMVSYGIFKEE